VPNYNPQPTPTEKPVGPVIGLIVILAIILVGGVYFWMSRQNNGPYNNSYPAQESASSVDEIKTQSSSTDGASIDADLRAFGETDISGDTSF
jgi:FtsZ-interacting cell division protein ZipA